MKSLSRKLRRESIKQFNYKFIKRFSLSSASSLDNNNDEDIVITGLSGRFPQSDNIEEFKNNLFNKADMVTQQDRFKSHKIPSRFGFIKSLHKFDAGFFGIVPKLAHFMDPQHRKLLEVTFEAIVDAGINPDELRGSRTGVYAGGFGSESLEYWILASSLEAMDGYSAVAVSNFALANRVSFSFDLTGPSMVISTGCSASLVALETAVQALKAGVCDHAIVAGSSVQLSPAAAIDFGNMNALALDGRCKTFDKSADGFVRAEAIVAMLVQKKKNSKRSYATIKAIKSNSDGYKQVGLMYPSGQSQEKLLRQIYEEAGIPTEDVSYVEAHGTGTPIGDPQELSALYNVLCKDKNRQNPLLLGSVKSNMGHGESAAGLCGLAKVIIGIQENNTMPPNLHFNEPMEKLAHIFNSGSAKVVTQATPLDGGYIGVSSLGIGGTNAHLVIQIEPCQQVGTGTSSTAQETKHLPVILPFSGRTSENVQESLKRAEEHVKNAEFVGLIHNVFRKNIRGHQFRGYSIVDQGNLEKSADIKATSGPIDRVNAVTSVEGEMDPERPIFFVFPGMGSQWNQMGKDLMKIDCFADSIHKSRTTLKNLGVDLDKLLAPNNSSIFKDIRDAFASIFSMQIALYDTLTHLGIKPSGFLGHSSGEILCAYADSCFTAEQTLIVGDARGRAMRSPYPGAMASVALSWEELVTKCPPNIYPACHNSAQNVTISGSQKSIREFVKELNEQGIFAKEVNSCNYAAHSPLPVVAGAAEKFLEYLQELGIEEKERSPKWISTSVAETDWNNSKKSNSKLNSALYHANNIRNPVMFHRAVQKIPRNALVIEIAPHGMFQSILKESLGSKSVVVAPMTSKTDDKTAHFLNALGKVYNSGVDINFGGLYAPVSFPVSAQTPGLSSLVKWDHRENWTTPIIENPTKMGLDGVTKKIDLGGKGARFLEGHRLDNRIVYPATGYLILAWQCYAESLGLDYKNCPVSFSDISFERATYLNEDQPTYFLFNLLDGSGLFEITESGALVVRGHIQIPENVHQRMFSFEIPQSSMVTEHAEENEDAIFTMTNKDVYKELRLRGYNYTGDFMGIQKINMDGKSAQVVWKENWVTFLDSVLQTLLLTTTTRLTAVPVRFQQVSIDPKALLDYVKIQQDLGSNVDKGEPSVKESSQNIPVMINETLKAIQCPGAEFRGLTAMVIPRKRQNELLSVEEYKFSPYFDTKHLLSDQTEVSPSQVVAGLIDLVLENLPSRKIKITDVFGKAEKSRIEAIYQAMIAKPGYNTNLSMVSTAAETEKLDSKVLTYGNVSGINSFEELAIDPNTDLLFADETVISQLDNISKTFKDGSYLAVCSENTDEFKDPEHFIRISEKYCGNSRFLLLQKKTSTPDLDWIRPINVDGPFQEWLPLLQSSMAATVHHSTPSATSSTSGELNVDVSEKHPSPPSRIYLTSQNNPTSGIIGLVKCLKKEAGGEKIRCIFDPQGRLDELNFVNPDRFLKEIIDRDLVMNIFKNGKIGSYRHFPMVRDQTAPLKGGEQAYVNTTTPGDLSSLKWIKSPLSIYNPITRTPVEKLVHVCYAAMNFRDIMLASGRLPIDPNSLFAEHVMGIEFSGIDDRGRRICGFPMSNSLATAVLGNSELTWEIPKNWSLEEAATIPIAYATAYYALFKRGRLEQSQSILIHSGTGGVGMAAINLALSKNCRIFTTVGSEEKRRFITELFPSLHPENIGNSRDTSFEQQILEQTGGQGVEVVLNSLADDKLHASLRCLAPNGKFLEIGELDMFKNSMMGLGTFLKNVEFHGVLMANVLSLPEGRKYVHDVISEGLEKGEIKPLPTTVFQPDQIEEAFRYMARGKHMGKVLIKVQEEKNFVDDVASCSLDTSAGLQEQPMNQSTVEAVPKTYFHPDKKYIVVGGLGGLGLEVADWLADKGANHLVLVSRSGVTTGYQRRCLRKWQEKGATVETPELDLSVYETARDFVNDVSDRGTIGGIFNSSLVLKDGLIENQTPEMFQTVAGPKIQITHNLDILSRYYCPNLDYFVVFSSMACGRGNAGQSNYGLSNSVMERICEQRREEGFHGLAIQWGVIGEVGYVAEKLTLEASRKRAGSGDEIFDGTVAQRIQSCLEVLDAALQQNSPIISSMVIGDANRVKSQRAGILSTFTSAFGIKDIATIPTHTKLVDLGMDSLIGIELKQALERDYDLALTPGEMRQLTFGDLMAVDSGTFVKGQASDLKNSGVLSMSKCLVQLKKSNGWSGDRGDGGSASLFMVHGTDGHAALLEPLATKLPVDCYAFQLFEGQQTNSVVDLAALYVQELKLVQPKGPYNICGYSSGGVIAYEMVAQLERDLKEKVSNLIILDGCLAFKPEELNSKGIAQHWLDSFGDTDMKLPYLKRLSESEEENIKVCLEFAKLKLILNTKADELRMEEFLRKKMRYMQMIYSHQPTYRYKGNVVLIKAAQVSTIFSQIKDTQTYNVQGHCDGCLSVHTVEGHHESFLSPQMVQQTADILEHLWKEQKQQKPDTDERENKETSESMSG